MELADLFWGGRAKLPPEVLAGVEAAVRSEMPLSPGVAVESVALMVLGELAFLDRANRIDVTGWAKTTNREEIAEELERVGGLSQELRETIAGLSPFAKIYLRGQLDPDEADDQTIHRIAPDRHDSYKRLFGSHWPGMPGPEIDLFEMRLTLVDLLNRSVLAAESIRSIQTIGRPRLIHQHSFARGIWHVWCETCGSPPVPNNRFGEEWPFLKLLRRIGKLVDPDFNGSQAAQLAYAAHRDKKGSDKGAI